MNDKYFTPKMEELRIGLECEIPMNTPDNFVKVTLSTVEDMGRIFSSYNNIRIRVPVLNEEQLDENGWLKKGEIYYKSLWNLVLLPNYKIVIKFGDEKRFMGKCKDINTLRQISKLLEIE